MRNNQNGYTLVEMIIVISLIGILILIGVSTSDKLYDRVVITSTAMEIKNDLQLCQQLSLNESRTYCIQFIGESYRVKDKYIGGKIISVKKLHKNISLSQESDQEILYNRHGTTGYGKIVLLSSKGKKIKIDTLIGTGRVRVSNIY